MAIWDHFLYSSNKNGTINVLVNRNKQFIRQIKLNREFFYFQLYLQALYTTLTSNYSEYEAFHKCYETGKICLIALIKNLNLLKNYHLFIIK